VRKPVRGFSTLFRAQGNHGIDARGPAGGSGGAGVARQFVRPILIRKGADIPLLPIMAGVVGGLIAFGLLGIFIGPTVLAVAYTLFNSWIGENPKRPPANAAAEPAGEKEAAIRKA